MIRTECDNCKALAEAPPPAGWVYLSEVVPAGQPEGLAAVLGHGGSTIADTAGVFCGYRCAGEYATAKALLDSAGSGESPP